MNIVSVDGVDDGRRIVMKVERTLAFALFRSTSPRACGSVTRVTEKRDSDVTIWGIRIPSHYFIAIPLAKIQNL